MPISIILPQLTWLITLFLTGNAQVLEITFKEGVEIRKPYTISVLNMIPFTGMEPENGDACKYSSQIVTDAINAQQDVLPNYHIEMAYADEFIGRYAARAVMTYDRSYDEDVFSPTGERLYRSPIIVGPQYSTGCKAIGPVLNHINSVAISTYCTAPYLTEHSRFPNLYLTLTTGKTMAFAILQFMREIGHWNRFAIITNAGNINDYGMALYLYDKAISLGMVVPWFDMIVDVDPGTLASLKQYESRVLVIASSNYQLTVKILCEAYKNGMTGDHYAFIGDNSATPDPLQLPGEIYPGCTDPMLKEGMKHTIWIGSRQFPIDEDRQHKSFLGHTWPVFEELLKNTSNMSIPVDYMSRYMCYDGTLQGIRALHATEAKLNRLKLTLRDYALYPESVVKLANLSVLEMNVAGLRSPKNMTYSSGGQVASDIQDVQHWNIEDGIVTVATVVSRDNGTDFQYGSFILRIESDQDYLRLYKPPRDYPLLVRIDAKISKGIFFTVLVIACISGVCQVSFMVLTFLTSVKGKLPTSAFPNAKLFGYFGCLLVSASSVLFAVPDVSGPLPTIRVVLLVIGLSLETFVLSFRPIVLVQQSQTTFRSALFTRGTKTVRGGVAAIRTGVKSEPQRSVNGTQCRRSDMIPLETIFESNDSELTGSYARRMASAPVKYSYESSQSEAKVLSAKEWNKFDNLTNALSLTFTLPCAIVVACWMSLDPIICANQMAGDALYSEESDTVTETWLTNCVSVNAMEAWLIALVFCHVVTLFISLLFAYRLAYIGVFVPELVYIRIGAGNATTLLLGALLVIVTLETSVSKHIAVAFFSLTSSGLTTLTWFIPTVGRLMRFNV